MNNHQDGPRQALMWKILMVLCIIIILLQGAKILVAMDSFRILLGW